MDDRSRDSGYGTDVEHRGWVDDAVWLWAASILMGLSIAAFQTALPSAVSIWTPSHLALGSAVYLNGMMVGELAAAGLTIPWVMRGLTISGLTPSTPGPSSPCV